MLIRPHPDLCPLAACAAFWLDTAHQQAFHGTDARFKAHLPFFLPVYLVLEDEKVMTVLGRKDAVDHCDRGFEVTAILWQLLEYSKVKASQGISSWRQCARDLTKERNVFFVFCCQTAGSGMYRVQAKCSLCVLLWERRGNFLQKIKHLSTIWGRISNVTILAPSHYAVFRDVNAFDYHEKIKIKLQRYS